MNIEAIIIWYGNVVSVYNLIMNIFEKDKFVGITIKKRNMTEINTTHVRLLPCTFYLIKSTEYSTDSSEKR